MPHCDNCPEFVSATPISWLAGWASSWPSSRGAVERFNGTMPSYVLDVEDVDTVIEACSPESMVVRGIHRCPHRKHGILLTPRHLAENWKALTSMRADRVDTLPAAALN